ncbi:MAG: hypothetical protein ACOYD4_11660 [Solirubrobacterales bacterium]
MSHLFDAIDAWAMCPDGIYWALAALAVLLWAAWRANKVLPEKGNIDANE